MSTSIFRSMSTNAKSIWSSVPLAPPDKILGLNEMFKKDTCPQKINLGVGAYRDDHGKPYVLNAVLSAENKIMAKSMNKE